MPRWNWGFLTLIFPDPLFSDVLPLLKRWLPLNITFMFDRCHRSLLAMIPVIYENDSINLVGNFVKSKMSLSDKLTNGAYHPSPLDCSTLVIIIVDLYDCNKLTPKYAHLHRNHQSLKLVYLCAWYDADVTTRGKSHVMTLFSMEINNLPLQTNDMHVSICARLMYFIVLIQNWWHPINCLLVFSCICILASQFAMNYWK